MDDTVKVVVLGTGQMGSGMIKLLLQKSGVDLVGVYGRRGSRVGLDVGKAIGLDTALGVQVTNDLPAVLGHTRPHVVLQATSSRVVEAVDEITAIDLVLEGHGLEISSETRDAYISEYHTAPPDHPPDPWADRRRSPASDR